MERSGSGSGLGTLHPVVAWAMIGLVVMGLISLGVLPRSCGKLVPGGREQFKNDCDACDGSGKATGTCPACRGRGYYGGVRCAECGGDGKVENKCAFCAGSGRKPTR